MPTKKSMPQISPNAHDLCVDHTDHASHDHTDHASHDHTDHIFLPIDEEQLKSELRASGLRLTVSRLAVFALLRKVAKPLSYTDVLHLLGNESWDKATLYRNLIDLCEVGLIQEVDVGGKVIRYELKGKKAIHHSHFVCTSCGDIQCFPTFTLNATEDQKTHEDKLPKSIQAGLVDIQVRGCCDTCYDKDH